MSAIRGRVDEKNRLLRQIATGLGGAGSSGSIAMVDMSEVRNDYDSVAVKHEGGGTSHSCQVKGRRLVTLLMLSVAMILLVRRASVANRID